jgi:hypothetical protein
MKRLQLVGSYKLLSMRIDINDGTSDPEYFGKCPSGTMVVTGTRLIAIIAHSARLAGRSEAQKAKLLDSLIAWAGSYRIDGEKIVCNVDISANQTWTGTEQIRFFEVKGVNLMLKTPPMPQADASVTVVASLNWERVE